MENEQIYLKMKIFVAKHVRKAKAKYYADYFKRYSNDGRKQWQMINRLLNKQGKNKGGINKLIDGEEKITDPGKIAEKFNNYFCNIAQQLKDEDNSEKIPPELKYSKRCLIDMPTTPCTLEEIEICIKNLKNKATSDVAVNPLKYVGKEISPVIHELVCSSLAQGIFPEPLKCAKVIPLHKEGPKTDVTNYRPISLLSVFSKIYERIMHTRLVNHLQSNGILHNSQYGFRAGHSCEHAILEAQNKITQAIDKKKIALLLLVDFSKAFDMVEHDILLRKLEHYGVRGVHLRWFASYLHNRKQYVNIDNASSEKHLIKYAVPQGSILGPTLFIVYINDLPEISKLAKFIFFADDANIIITGTTMIEIQEQASLLLKSIETWVRSNGMRINLKKTKYMVFTNKFISNDPLELFLNETKIKITESERFLGVIMDSKLNWKTHISKLACKLSRNAGILYKLKGLVPNSVLKLVYNSHVQSHVNYCSNIWGLGSKNSINSIFIAQKKAIRSIENGYVNYFYNKETGEIPCHTKEIFDKNGLLTIHNIIAKNCLVAMHRIFRKSYPTNVMAICQVNTNKRPSRHEKYFIPVTFRLRKSDATLPYAGAKLYNYTCEAINSILEPKESKLEDKFLNGFKNRVNKYLIELQKNGDETWSQKNFMLYNALKH